MKLKNRTKLIVSIMLTLLLIVSISVSWFFTSNDVEVNHGSTIQCEAGNSLEISLDGGKTWSGRVDYNTVSPKIIDITGDGVNLYRPKVIDELAQPQSFVTASKIDEEGNGDYIELEVMLRSASKMNIYLSGESAITPVSTSSQQFNPYGNFSKDYIAGAVRVAVVEEVNNTEELRLLWAPNPNYQLSLLNGVYSFSEGGSREESYKYYYTPSGDIADLQLATVTRDQYASKQFVFGSTEGTITSTGNSPVLTALDSKAEGENFYTKTLKIRVWFEGTDREADQALSGGWVNMLFKFNGVQKLPAEAEKQQAIDDLAYYNNSVVGLKEGMQYTYNGFNWTTYKAGDTINFTSQTAWYFRYPETDTNFETTYNKITTN